MTLSHEDSRKLRLLEARLNPMCAASRSPVSSRGSSGSGLNSKQVSCSRRNSRTTSEGVSTSSTEHILVRCGAFSTQQKESLKKAADRDMEEDDVGSFSSESLSCRPDGVSGAQDVPTSCDIARERNYAPPPSQALSNAFVTPMTSKDGRAANHFIDGFATPPEPPRKQGRRKRGRADSSGSPSASLARTSRVDNYFKPISTVKSVKKARATNSSPEIPNICTSLGSLSPQHKYQEVRREIAFQSPSSYSSPRELGTVSEQGVSLRSADAYAYFRNAIESLKARLADCERRNDALELDNKELVSENEDLRAELVELQLVKTELIQQKEKQASLDSHVSCLQDVLCDVMKQLSSMHRKEARRKSRKASERLGKVVTERNGTSFSDVWQDGYEIIENRERLQQLSAEREDVERKRRDLQKTKKNLPPQDLKHLDPEAAAITTIPYENTAEYAAELDETLKLQALVFKREETHLMEARGRMLTERDCLFREVSRQNDETASSFGNFPILRKRYLLLNLLGRGGFSEVFRAFDLQEVRYVACKVHQLASNWSEKRKHTFLRHMLRENQIHQSLSHPRILRAYDSFERDNLTVVSVLELCEGTDLDVILRKSGSLPEREARSIISQIFAGLEYLDRHTIVHYDLKPGNILLHKGEVRITDFGLSK